MAAKHRAAGPAARRTLPVLVALFLGATLLIWPAVPALAGPGDELVPRAVAPKPVTSKVLRGYSRTILNVKFAEGSGVRLHGNGVTSDSDTDVSEVNALLRRHPGATIGPLFKRARRALERDRQAAQRASRQEHADLSLYLRVVLPPRSDIEAILDELNALAVVEFASAEPLPQDPPVTPDFQSLQGYVGAVPDGIGARLVRATPGARGSHVQVVDLEYGWRRNHEDVSKAALPGALIPNGTPFDPWDSLHNHGTAVAGILVGDENSYGVTGIVPDATLRMVNTYSSDTGYELAAAIDLARANMSAGDVMLLEQQVVGPVGGCQPGCVPVEWYRAYYDVIVQATAAGIVVVEAAGNGSQDLGDASLYGSTFPNGLPNSGAIIVGAGAAPGCGPARSRLEFSNYGPRVNVQGWGNCVTTTGYGDLQAGSTVNQWYTSSFSGTSSASAIVAGAAAAISSAHEAAYGVNLTSRQVRRILIDTGTPQNTTSAGALSGTIGPLPNLPAALADLGQPDTTPPVVSAPNADFRTNVYVGTSSTPVKLSVGFSATDAGGVTSTRLQQKVNTASFADVALPTAAAVSANVSVPTSNTTVRRFRARATDTAGNTSTYAAAPFFKVVVRQNGSSAVVQSGSWTTKSNTKFYGGSVRASSTAGARQSLTATMQDVAIVSTRGPNRGKAQVRVDGVLVATINLYNATTQARRVVWAMSFDSAATHTVEFVVTGTKSTASTGRRVDFDAFLLMQP